MDSQILWSRIVNYFSCFFNNIFDLISVQSCRDERKSKWKLKQNKNQKLQCDYCFSVICHYHHHFLIVSDHCAVAFNGQTDCKCVRTILSSNSLKNAQRYAQCYIYFPLRSLIIFSQFSVVLIKKKKEHCECRHTINCILYYQKWDSYQTKDPNK